MPPEIVLLPAMLFAGMIGGALWGFVPGFLRSRFDANETIITLLLNYVGALLVNALVFGPWKDRSNLGWPATVTFPAAATLPGLFGTRAHLGLVFGVIAALGFGILFTGSRWGRELSVLKGNAKVGRMIGLSFARQTMLVMSLGGALGGLAGICEVSAIQGRLQPGISVGYGLTGFLVRVAVGPQRLCRHHGVVPDRRPHRSGRLASALCQGAGRQRDHSARPVVRHRARRRQPFAAMERIPWLSRTF